MSSSGDMIISACLFNVYVDDIVAMYTDFYLLQREIE